MKELRNYLIDYGISTLNPARNLGEGSNVQSYWLTTKDLDLDGLWKYEWTRYIKGLAHGGIRLNDEQDSLLWMHNKVNGEVTASLACDLIVSSNLPKSPIRTHSQLWSCDSDKT